MDPNACLNEIRDLTGRRYDTLGPDEAARLAELLDALDAWLTRGGCLPTAWARS